MEGKDTNQENWWQDAISSMTETFCMQEKRLIELEKQWKKLEEEREKRWSSKIFRKLKSYLKKQE